MGSHDPAIDALAEECASHRVTMRLLDKAQKELFWAEERLQEIRAISQTLSYAAPEVWGNWIVKLKDVLNRG